MKELFLNTDQGLVKIEEDVIKKYNLKEGMISPYSRFWIVDKNGITENAMFKHETSSPDVREMPAGEGLEDDEIVEFGETGAILSQSEILDFSEGTDSNLEQ